MSRTDITCAAATMSSCVETHASFRVMGEHLDPDAVTQRLGVQPTRT